MEEYNYITQNDISIHYVNKFIHPDDTIQRVKKTIYGNG